MAAAAAPAPAAPTQLSPFTVEAEFGVDGLRIQNSSAVLNQYQLEQHGVALLQDISSIAPNLYTSNSDSRGFGDVISLRGSANSIFFGAPSVALFVDDVPSGSVSAYPSSLLNVDSFVVKAGPQGSLYGRNAPGGVIDIKTRTPGTAHRGKLLADYGSYDAIAFQAGFDGPLGGNAGYAASFGYNEREGYIDNTFLKRSADDREAFAGRGSLYLKPNASLQLRFGVLIENVDDDATRLSSLFSPDPFTVASDLNGRTSLDREQFSFQARQKFSWGSLVATTSRQEWDLNPAENDLDLINSSGAFSQVLQNEKTWTQDFRFESNVGADKAQWRAGVFYFDSQVTGNAYRQFALPPGLLTPPGFVQMERTIFDIDQQNLAGYFSYDHPVSAATLVEMGLRLERTESDISRTKAASNNLGFPSPQDAPIVLDSGKNLGSVSLGLLHSLSESLSLRARSSIAHKPAGHTAFTGSQTLASFDSERSWANEVGVTFGPPKGTFGGSILGFWTQIDNYQFERTVVGSTDFIVVNAREVVSRGVEAKFMWNPISTVWWDFQAGFTDAQFENHRDATGASVNGKRVPFIPRSTLRTGVTVDLGGGFSANASYVSAGRTYYDERNTTAVSQKGYGTINAQLRYRFDRWTATVYGQNLADKEYYQFINPEIFAGSPGAPRRFGFQLSYEY